MIMAPLYCGPDKPQTYYIKKDIKTTFYTKSNWGLCYYFRVWLTRVKNYKWISLISVQVELATITNGTTTTKTCGPMKSYPWNSWGKKPYACRFFYVHVGMWHKMVQEQKHDWTFHTNTVIANTIKNKWGWEPPNRH